MNRENTLFSRRSVLRSIGAGVLGSVAISGSASARRNYGNGNGIGAFLNEPAAFKDRPVWNSGLTDMTGQAAVDVTVGTSTSVDVPAEIVPDGIEPPEELPMAYDPMAVEVSPGTDVTWTWAPENEHTVTAVDGTGAAFDFMGGPGDTFTYTFEEPGVYLYYCIPHGTPYPIDFGPPLGEVDNLFGMRGVVKVSE